MVLLSQKWKFFLPSKEVATPLKFFTTNLCRSSPAQTGKTHILTTKHTPVPRTTNNERERTVWSICEVPDTSTTQNVNVKILNPYSYGFIDG